MDKNKLLSGLFDRKIIQIINVFLQEPSKQFYLKEISDNSGVPIATTHRVLQKLKKLDLIKELKIAKFKVYQLKQTEKTMFLGGILKQSVKVLEYFVEKVQTLPNVVAIILQGQEEKDRANLIVIGDRIDSTLIKEVSQEIKDKHNYLINYMVLTSEQYEQMTQMGLYSGNKRILFERED
ncbi:helix-turn-helix domain-containing protein [Nanoarchaeota archaeon]